MNTAPSLDDLIAAVIMGIDDDILPELDNPKAQATAFMMQSILQSVRQLLPVIDERLADEHNAMTKTLRDVAAAIGDADGVEADRVRNRAATFGQRDDLPAPFDREAAVAAHQELGETLDGTLIDLDAMQRAGVATADEALAVLRGHLGPRFVRDVMTVSVGEGFIGRG